MNVETILTYSAQDATKAAVLSYEDRVRRACALLAGNNPAARAYLECICYAARLMDDAVDADHGPVEYHRLFHVLLVELPANPFFQANREALIAMHSATLNAWQDADAWLATQDIRRQHALGLLVAYLVGGYEHRRAVSLQVRELLLKPES
jgi:DNA-binding GntR family transcriptional regulator